MDEGGKRDLELLLLAVRQGILTNTQVEECLHEWGDFPPVPGQVSASLSSTAVRRGYLSEERLRGLSTPAGKSDPEATTIPVDVVMKCPACGSERTLPIEGALKRPRCNRCPAPLRFLRQSSSGGTKAVPAALPQEVQEALKDPKNRFSKYVLLGKLGSGGMGEVWAAWDTVMNRRIALKFPKSMEDDEVRRLYLEARGAGSLTHANIASIYEIAEADGRHYIAMQYISGVTAEEAVKRKKIEPREIVRWIRDAARGVHDAHERGVIHRDLKPANVMIDDEGRVFVMDFGLAKLVGGQGSGTVSGVILGTPAYMPPEQASGNAPQVDRRSDVYCLGASLYVLLSGRRPYDGETATDILVQILTTEAAPLKQAWPEAPWELDAIVNRAMSRSREARYATAKELADDLERYLAHQPIEAKPDGLATVALKKIRRRQTPLAFAGAALVIVVLTFLVLHEPPAPPPVVIPPVKDRLKEWSTLFASLTPVLGAETFDRKAAEPLLSRVRREFPEQQAEVDRFVENESRSLERVLRALPRQDWLESADRVRRYRDWLEFTKQPTAGADRILAYRGTFSLAIQVSPYAQVKSPYVEKLPLEDRVTPLLVRDVEIGDTALELIHPQLGSRIVTIPPLRNGEFIVLEGDLRKPETLKIREGP